MGFFSKMQDRSNEKFLKEIEPYLLENEEIQGMYGLFVEFACLTNKRLIFGDKTKGTHNALVSIPYNRIDAIAIQKVVASLKPSHVEIVSKGKEYELKFGKDDDIMDFYKMLCEKML